MRVQFDGLQDIQWEFLEPCITSSATKRRKGKPHTPGRKICNSLFWILITGSRWRDLPRCAIWDSRSVTHRWLSIWQENGTLQQIIGAIRDHVALAEMIVLGTAVKILERIS
ncbi:MAG: transposase [Chlamydia sp.]